MIDFTNLPKKNKTYAGANGSKISVLYNGEQYMLKFPAIARKNQELSYTNGCISEYLGCQIFKSIGIPVQETLLGTYTKNGKEKIVVACKDFTSVGVVLQDFASLKNTIIDSEHNGNWGFLYNVQKDTMELAPVYDCGSCLYPQADENIMEATLNDPKERELRIFSIPLSGIRLNGQKIKYFDFLSSLSYEDCNEALKRITPQIDMNVICSIIDSTPYITDLQKRFYKTMLSERKKKILDFSLNKLLNFC